VAKGLFQRAQRRVAAFTDAERREMLEMFKLNKRPESLSYEALGGGAEGHTEVTLNEGDLLVLDPMTTHSASANAGSFSPGRHCHSTLSLAAIP
jgi:ectoine hydroxylase-related dioxygenase (phytanoyl-CoA dioxygenase family)